MDKILAIILQISLLIISVIYFQRTENKLLKSSIGLFGLAIIGLLIKKFTGLSILGFISYFLIYFASILLFLIHLFKNRSITLINKSLLGVIAITVLFSFILDGFHLPGKGLFRIFSIAPIGLIIFLNFKKLEELREELRMIDLMGIVLILDLLIFIKNLTN